MDVNDRAKLGEAPRRASVIKMNVTKENVPNVRGVKASAAQRGGDVIKGRLWTGVEQHEAISSLKGRRRDNAADAELVGVKDVNHRVVSHHMTAQASTIKRVTGLNAGGSALTAPFYVR
jgi:hypothetical protein